MDVVNTVELYFALHDHITEIRMGMGITLTA